MKKMLCIVLTLALLLCGCRSAGPTPGELQEQTEETAEIETQIGFTEIETPGVTLPIGEWETSGGDETIPEQTGRVRVPYTGNVSSVRYITGVDALPDNEALAAYDETYFETKALLVVMETVGSGSVEVGIESISNGVVTLYHHLPGDAGTADMATWLIWAEVDAGLDAAWSVANPALEPNTSAY